MAMLEYGPTYELTKSVITSKLNSAGDLEDDTDPTLPVGTRFTVHDRNKWDPYSANDRYFYVIRVKNASGEYSEYKVLAHRLEQDSQKLE